MSTFKAVPTPTSTPMRIALYLPPLLEEGVRALLEEHREQAVTQPWHDGASCDVLLIDPSMSSPPATGWMVPRVALVPEFPQSRHAEVRLAGISGAARVLTLDADAMKILAELRSASVQRIEEPAVTAEGDETAGHHREDPASALSPRELQVVSGICRGLSNAEIGVEVFLGINTIKTYIRNAYRKMGVETRSQAVIWGIEHGLGRSQARPSGHAGA